MDEHGDELYADFLRYYHVDLRDLWTGRLTPRLVLALVRHLPWDSAYVTALRGGAEYVGWDRHAQILADVYDAINTLTYVFRAAHSDKPKKVKPLPPYPRPGVKAEEKPKLPNPLLARLRGEDVPAPVLGPGSRVPPPPPRL